MTDPNNWPDPAKPGYPLNPERDGWHWLAQADCNPCPAYWRAAQEEWMQGGLICIGTAHVKYLCGDHFVGGVRYIGPCLTPAEVEAREQAARREGMEEAAQEVDCGCAARQDVLRALADVGERRAKAMCLHGYVCCALQAATIRAAAKEVG
jgi:hypothetical protein